MINEVKASVAGATVKVGTCEWGFGLGTQANRADVVPLSGKSEFIPDRHWGKKVIGVVPMVFGCTNEIVSLSYVGAEVHGENQIKLTVNPIPGHSVLIAVRAVVFYFE